MNEEIDASLPARSLARDLLIRLRDDVQSSNGERSTESLLDLLDAIKAAWKGTATVKDDLLDDAYHFANHYLSDEDVMRSNPAYAAKLNEQLDRYLVRLNA